MDIKELQKKAIEFRDERDWAQYHNPKDLAISISPMILASLDMGEAAVIHLALEEGIGTVCIDEWKGRRVAPHCGIQDRRLRIKRTSH